MANNNTDKAKKTAYYVVGGLLLFKVGLPILDGIKSLLNNLGAGRSDEQIRVENEIVNNESPFSPHLWKKYPGALIFYDEYARKLCYRLLGSTNPLFDDFNIAMGVIKECKTQTQVSFLAYKFNELFKADLLTWLLGDMWPNDHFSAAEVDQMVAYAKKLPLYKL